MPKDLADTPDSPAISASTVAYTGVMWNVVRETFELPEATQPLTREYIQHPGAVAILCLNERAEVLLINQYRHPVGLRAWEIPAGMRDVPGEPLVETAVRELAEEADLRARSWRVLSRVHPSPGSSSEGITVFLARDLDSIPAATRTEEESGIIARWVDLETAAEAAVSGRLSNSIAMLAVLAAARLGPAGWDRLPAAGA